MKQVVNVQNQFYLINLLDLIPQVLDVLFKSVIFFYYVCLYYVMIFISDLLSIWVQESSYYLLSLLESLYLVFMNDKT